MFPRLPVKKRNIYIMVVAGLFGVLAWVSVNLREQYIVTLDAPFAVENVPEGLAVKSPIPGAMQLKFRGDGWRLAGLLLGRHPKLVFSVNTLPPGNRPISFNDVADRVTLPAGVQLLDVKPESVRVSLGKSGRKLVPVVLDYSAAFRDGYGQVGTTSITPDSVTITGAEVLLNSIEVWKTERREFENLKASVDVSIPLAPPEPYLLTFSSPAVRVVINVEPFAEKQFSGITVDVADVPADREVILIPPRIEIVVRAGIKQLSALSSAEFHIRTTYRRIAADSTGSVETDIAAPPGVQIVSRRPEHLQYIVRKRL